MSEKYKTAASYSSDRTKDCETVLVVLLQTFGSFKHTLRLVGGLVPRYVLRMLEDSVARRPRQG